MQANHSPDQAPTSNVRGGSRSLAKRLSVGAFALAFGPLVAAQPKAADPIWDKVGETPALTLYMDRSTLQKEGAIHRVIEMQDLKSADPEGVWSRRYLNEYDCENKMHRIGRMTSYSGALLSGKKLFDVSEMGYWRRIPVNGLFTLAYQLHCPGQIQSGK